MTATENGGRGAGGHPHPPPAAWDAAGHGAPDTTLGGYFREHGRPPGFEGPDGEPYTVALEVEKTPNLAAPFEGYLVFPKWATTGLGVVGHVETPTLAAGKTRDAVLETLGELPLSRVKGLLDEAVARRDGGRADRPPLSTGEGT
jgi:hypothetical protein